MTAREQLLERAPRFTEAEAAAALRAVEATAELADYLDHEASLTHDELDERERRWAEANSRDAVRDERW